MKKLLSIFMIYSCMLFSFSQETAANIEKAVAMMGRNEWDECLKLLTNCIEDEKVANVEKIHYLLHRKQVYSIFDDVVSYLVDANHLKFLCTNDKQCNLEWQFHYGKYELQDEEFIFNNGNYNF